MNRYEMDMRRMSRDGRNPYGASGGYVVSGRGRRGRRDRARNRDYLMMEDMRRYNMGESDYELSDLTRQRQPIRHDPYMPRDYAYDDYRSRDYGTGEPYAGVDDFYNRKSSEMGRNSRDGHYPMGSGSTYYPIEAMGRFNGYWGMPQEDYARGGRRDYNYDYAGDYGETLSKEELEHWNKKLMKDMDEKGKQFFSKENIAQKARQMGVEMKGFNEEELLTSSLNAYKDYCDAVKPYVGTNMDIYVAMGKAFLNDKDAAIKGGEKLAVYYDCIVEGEDD